MCPFYLHLSDLAATVYSVFSFRLSQGATIKRNEITGEIFIARVIHGGLADRSGEPFFFFFYPRLTPYS